MKDCILEIKLGFCLCALVNMNFRIFEIVRFLFVHVCVCIYSCMGDSILELKFVFV